MKNSLCDYKYLPHFSNFKVSEVEPAVKSLIENIKTQIKEIESKNNKETILKDLEKIDLYIQKIWGPVAHLISVANSKELRDIYETCQEKIVKLELSLAQNKTIHKLLSLLKSSSLYNKINASEQRLLSKKLLENKLMGIDLDVTNKERFNEICKELNALSTVFQTMFLMQQKHTSLF